MQLINDNAMCKWKKFKIYGTRVAKAATLVIKYLNKNLLHNQSLSINKKIIDKNKKSI